MTSFFVNYGRHPRVPAVLGLDEPLINLPHTAQADLRASSDRRGSKSHDALNAAMTRAAAQRGAALDRSTVSSTASWAQRSLINPGSRRAVALAVSPANIVVSTPDNCATAVSSLSRDPLERFVKRREATARFVRDALASAVDQQKDTADKHSRSNHERFVVSNKVLLSTNGIATTAVRNIGAAKLTPRYNGPFTIIKVQGDAYKLDLQSTMRLHKTFTWKIQALRSGDDP